MCPSPSPPHSSTRALSSVSKCCHGAWRTSHRLYRSTLQIVSQCLPVCQPVTQYKDNLALRVRYPDAPEKFLDSEVDLDEQIKSLLQVLCVSVCMYICVCTCASLPHVHTSVFCYTPCVNHALLRAHAAAALRQRHIDTAQAYVSAYQLCRSY
jgi:hypothetical protein